MTRNIWIYLPMSLADIDAELPDMSGELPRIPTVGNAMGQRGLKGTIDNALNLNLMSGCSCPSRPWRRGRSPMHVLISPDDDAPRRCMCVLHAGR